MSKFEKSSIEFDDGRYHRANLGFIVLSGDLACEHDIFNMTPEGVGVSFTRLKTDDYTTTETLAAHVEQLAEADGSVLRMLKLAWGLICPRLLPWRAAEMENWRRGCYLFQKRAWRGQRGTRPRVPWVSHWI